MTETTAKPIQHIQSPVTGKFLCGWVGPHSGMYAGLDNAYRDAVIGNPSSPCPDCVKAGAIALGVHL